LDKRWRNLLIIVLALALAAGAYYFLSNPGTGPIQNQGPNSTNAKLDIIFSKYGAERKTFSGTLPVELTDDGVTSKIKPASFAGLRKDLNALELETKSPPEKALVSIYLNAVVLSETEYDVLRQVQQLSSEIKGKDQAAACAYQDRLPALNLRYADFFISVNDLSLQEIDYSQKYGDEKPLGLNTDKERATMDSLSFLSELYSNSCTDVAA